MTSPIIVVENVYSILGGKGNDTFIIFKKGELKGTIDGKEGTNTLIYYDKDRDPHPASSHVKKPRSFSKPVEVDLTEPVDDNNPDFKKATAILGGIYKIKNIWL